VIAAMDDLFLGLATITVIACVIVLAIVPEP
jgi:hypothetical protein